MLIATLSYSKFVSIQLQSEESAEKSNKSRKICFLFCKCWSHWHCHLLTDNLQSVFSIKRMRLKWT